jgi:hypothetical protein
VSFPEEAGAPVMFGCLAFSGFIIGLIVGFLIWGVPW